MLGESVVITVNAEHVLRDRKFSSESKYIVSHYKCAWSCFKT
jgi:hypothetical protein